MQRKEEILPEVEEKKMSQALSISSEEEIIYGNTHGPAAGGKTHIGGNSPGTSYEY